jgi:hypothetical protein
MEANVGDVGCNQGDRGKKAGKNRLVHGDDPKFVLAKKIEDGRMIPAIVSELGPQAHFRERPAQVDQVSSVLLIVLESIGELKHDSVELLTDPEGFETFKKRPVDLGVLARLVSHGLMGLDGEFKSRGRFAHELRSDAGVWNPIVGGVDLDARKMSRVKVEALGLGQAAGVKSADPVIEGIPRCSNHDGGRRLVHEVSITSIAPLAHVADQG